MRAVQRSSGEAPAWELVEDVLDQLLDLPQAERPDRLFTLCAGNTALQREVESLLAAESERPLTLEGFLGATETGRGSLAPGDDLGPYEILELLGEGGMGRVYRARRRDVDKIVAIKLLKAQVSSSEALERFERERHVLARLEHPNIAPLLDAGVSDQGAPYLVMELIEGRRIDVWCNDQRLDLRQRVRLLLDVCAAVDYAHQALVVHRDLKPSNVLVSERGTAKLLDFGVAKPLEHWSENDDALTRTDHRLMTPSYAAPEQVLGEAIGTATDVYLLGSLLYELLTGRRALDLSSSSLATLAEDVRTREPALPSRAVLEVAQLPQGLGPRRSVARALRGDLDSILLRALAKRPQDRYSSVAALTADLERFLDDLPVRAREGTLPYRARKFAARHRWPLAAAALAVFALGGLAARENELRQRAEDEARKATAVGEFLRDMLTAADPDESRGDEVTVIETLDAAADRLARRASQEPNPVDASLRRTVGRTYRKLGRLDEAEPLLERALADHRALYGRSHPESVESLSELRSLHLDRGEDLLLTEAMAREVLDLRRTGAADGPEDIAEALVSLAKVLTDLERFEESEQALTRAIELLRSRDGDADVELDETLSTALNNLGSMLAEAGELERALEIHRRNLEVRRSLYGEHHRRVATTLNNIGFVFTMQRRYEEAAETFEQTLAVREEVLGADHAEVGLTLFNLAEVNRRLGAFERGVEQARRAVDVLENATGDQALWYALALNSLGGNLSELGDYQGATTALEEAYEVLTRLLGPGHTRVHRILERLALVAEKHGQPRQAARWRATLDASSAAAASGSSG